MKFKFSKKSLGAIALIALIAASMLAWDKVIDAGSVSSPSEASDQELESAFFLWFDDRKNGKEFVPLD